MASKGLPKGLVAPVRSRPLAPELQRDLDDLRRAELGAEHDAVAALQQRDREAFDALRGAAESLIAAAQGALPLLYSEQWERKLGFNAGRPVLSSRATKTQSQKVRAKFESATRAMIAADKWIRETMTQDAASTLWLGLAVNAIGRAVAAAQRGEAFSVSENTLRAVSGAVEAPIDERRLREAIASVVAHPDAVLRERKPRNNERAGKAGERADVAASLVIEALGGPRFHAAQTKLKGRRKTKGRGR